MAPLPGWVNAVSCALSDCQSYIYHPGIVSMWICALTKTVLQSTCFYFMMYTLIILLLFTHNFLVCPLNKQISSKEEVDVSRIKFSQGVVLLME